MKKYIRFLERMSYEDRGLGEVYFYKKGTDMPVGNVEEIFGVTPQKLVEEGKAIYVDQQGTPLDDLNNKVKGIKTSDNDYTVTNEEAIKLNKDVDNALQPTKKQQEEKQPENQPTSKDIEKWVWWYHNQGFSIIPLKEKDKRPNIDKWEKYHQQQPTKEEIQTWLDQELFKNIAVICGHVSDDLVVIDIDDEKIPKDIGLKLDKIAETGAWIVKTGKGYHIYCKHHGNPGGIKKPLKYKIEYRANRGYVVAPPSIHPNGKQYTFMGIKKPEDLPELEEKDVKSMFQDFKEKIGNAWNIKPSKAKTQTPSMKDKDKIRGYPRCVEIALNKVTKHPMRYYTIYGIASSFAMNNIPKEMAMKRIERFNMEKCSPKHKNHIVEQAVNGAYKEGSKKYGCEFWMDQAETCPYENIGDCYYGNLKIKRELAKEYKIFKWGEKTNKETKETYPVKTGVVFPNLAELIINEFDYHFVTTTDTKEIYYYNGGIYHSQGENIIRNISEEYMEQLSSKHGKNEIEDHIRDKNYKPRTIFNTPKHLINLANGIYNLRTKQLIPHNPKYFFINEIPVEYNPDAKCPKIIKFLKEVIDEKNIPCIQEFIGYCLFRDYPIHKAFMFIGSGKNGKSTTINLITTFLGRTNIANKELQQLTYDKFAKSKLYGRLINAAADISSSSLGSTGTFKGLTGGDYTDAEKKFMDSFEFKNYAKMVFSANTLPKTKDDSYAFYRRWILINFPNTFEGKECEPYILDKLTTPQEMSGLFNWAIKGLERLLKQNKFTYEKTVEDIRNQYKTLSDPVFAFCQKFLTSETSGYLIKKDVYKRYNEWSNENDLPVTPKNMFTQDLEKHLPNMQSGRSRINGRLTQVYNYINWKMEKTVDENPEHPEQLF